jgi:hypothetical protein
VRNDKTDKRQLKSLGQKKKDGSNYIKKLRSRQEMPPELKKAMVIAFFSSLPQNCANAAYKVCRICAVLYSGRD